MTARISRTESFVGRGEGVVVETVRGCGTLRQKNRVAVPDAWFWEGLSGRSPCQNGASDCCAFFPDDG
jgi:hypothetical protein